MVGGKRLEENVLRTFVYVFLILVMKVAREQFPMERTRVYHHLYIYKYWHVCCYSQNLSDKEVYVFNVVNYLVQGEL